MFEFEHTDYFKPECTLLSIFVKIIGNSIKNLV